MDYLLYLALGISGSDRTLVKHSAASEETLMYRDMQSCYEAVM